MESIDVVIYMIFDWALSAKGSGVHIMQALGSIKQEGRNRVESCKEIGKKRNDWDGSIQLPTDRGLSLITP